MKTVKEVANILKVHFRTIYVWIKQGKIKTVKIGKSHYISEAEVEKILKNGL